MSQGSEPKRKGLTRSQKAALKLVTAAKPRTAHSASLEHMTRKSHADAVLRRFSWQKGTD